MLDRFSVYLNYNVTPLKLYTLPFRGMRYMQIGTDQSIKFMVKYLFGIFAGEGRDLQLHRSLPALRGDPPIRTHTRLCHVSH